MEVTSQRITSAPTVNYTLEFTIFYSYLTSTYTRTAHRITLDKAVECLLQNKATRLGDMLKGYAAVL